MKIVHRISFSSTKDDVRLRELNELNVHFEYTAITGSSGLISLDVTEDHPEWNEINARAKYWGAVDVVRTEFTESELDEADHLVVIPQWINGYPMPDNDRGFIKITFGGSGCENCGAGRTQTSAFQLRSEPKWGRRAAMQLNWIPDQIFVRADAYNHVFAQFGVSFREVLHHKQKTILRSIVQLVIANVAESPLDLNTPKNTCGRCNIVRYEHPVRGLFPAFRRGTMAASVFRTQEIFGEGNVSWSEIIISAEVYQAIKRCGLRGFKFQPLQANPQA